MSQERLMQIILSPHISEKATLGAEKNNEFVFRVHDSATKPEIKEAIELLFETKVKSVRVTKVKPKKKTFRNIKGAQKGWKKAYVALEADQKLDVMGAQ